MVFAVKYRLSAKRPLVIVSAIPKTSMLLPRSGEIAAPIAWIGFILHRCFDQIGPASLGMP